MSTITRRYWNDELGSALVDWCFFGAGIVSLSVALVATVI